MVCTKHKTVEENEPSPTVSLLVDLSTPKAEFFKLSLKLRFLVHKFVQIDKTSGSLNESIKME